MVIKGNKNLGTLSLSQSCYIKKVVELFNMVQAKSIFVPAASHFKLCAVKGNLTKEESAYMKNIAYSNAYGSMMCATIGTRSDIAFGVSLIS